MKNEKEKKGHKPGDPKSNKETNKDIPVAVQKRMQVIQCPTCRGSGKRGIRVCTLCDGEKSIKVMK